MSGLNGFDVGQLGQRPAREPSPRAGVYHGPKAKLPEAPLVTPWGLTPVQAETFRLMTQEGLTQQEAAARMGVSEKTASTHVTRAIAKMVDAGVPAWTHLAAFLAFDRWYRNRPEFTE